MKNTTPPDFDPEIDNDSVWPLLDASSTVDPSPTFTQDTLRRTRLEAQPSTSWWHKLLSPPALAGTAIAACCAAAFLLSQNSDPLPTTPDITEHPTSQPDTWNDVEDAFASQMLVSAAEEPSLLSDEELVALLF